MFDAPSKKRSDRMVTLLELLQQRGQLSLAELAVELHASAATIRRDVAKLAEQGLLERTHGGCRPVQGSGELPVKFRDTRQAEAKKAIAQRVAREIPKGRHAIALTGGSTTAAVLRALAHRDDLTIITNSLSIGLEAAEMDHDRVLIAGGVLRTSSLELVGNLAEATMKLVNVGTAIVGADGATAQSGLTTHDEVEARTNHIMVERAQRVIAAVDSSKIGQVTLAPLIGITGVDLLVTDDRADEAELARIRAAGVEVVVVHVDH